jgi:hypothetical protein
MHMQLHQVQQMHTLPTRLASCAATSTVLSHIHCPPLVHFCACFSALIRCEATQWSPAVQERGCKRMRDSHRTAVARQSCRLCCRYRCACNPICVMLMRACVKRVSG